MARKWTPKSWRTKPIRQAPEYRDAKALAEVEGRLGRSPPLVFAGEARRLAREGEEDSTVRSEIELSLAGIGAPGGGA